MWILPSLTVFSLDASNPVMDIRVFALKTGLVHLVERLLKFYSSGLRGSDKHFVKQKMVPNEIESLGGLEF